MTYFCVLKMSNEQFALLCTISTQSGYNTQEKQYASLKCWGSFKFSGSVDALLLSSSLFSRCITEVFPLVLGKAQHH